MMRFGARLVSVALLGACAVGAASAQMPRLSAADDKAILCIYNSFDKEESAAVARGEVMADEKSLEQGAKAMLQGHEQCKALLKDQQRKDLAENVAIEEAIIDLALVQLKQDGLKSADGLYDVWRSLSPADQAYFLEEDAPDNAEFRVRMKKPLLKAGLPDNESDIDGGMLIMECISNLAVYYRAWVKLDADTTH